MIVILEFSFRLPLSVLQYLQLWRFVCENPSYVGSVVSELKLEASETNAVFAVVITVVCFR